MAYGYEYIIVAACKDDMITNFSSKAQTWLVELGSEKIKYLEYRHGFAFISNTVDS